MNKYKPARNAGTKNSLKSWLTLSHTAGIGSTTFHTLLKNFTSVEAILNASHQQLSNLAIKADVISALCHQQGSDIEASVEADLNWVTSKEHHIITLLDDNYPAQLKDLPDTPPLLYVRGDPDYLLQPQLAIVGTRNPTTAGRNTAKDFAQHLSNVGITITSGLASGIDGASHEGALRGLAGTIAVVAHGLDIVYPAQHQKLAQEISEKGAIVSEMPIGTQPRRGLFPRRNRLISAFSLGTLIVEAAQKSGSLITARYALEQNREVFAIPGSIHNPMARGCHQLIRQGAKLVESADDILEELRLPAKQNSPYPIKTNENIHENQKNSHKTLDPDHQKLLKCLAYEPASIDELVISSNFSAAEIASMLLILELEGIIACQNGRYSYLN
ncbi:Rossmann fold nucleotide-binding protein Smf possibly involved in DNA uptake [hydrothermal vent metagenome]|uniref:Rossmann fold nucleotide-binding protein Smf possibly involved in DNA uptake n=1 Tax=hydrothermal vent metagenome TaxID=652676 RepID=A0A3B0WJX8_9ZZZZ